VSCTCAQPCGIRPARCYTALGPRSRSPRIAALCLITTKCAYGLPSLQSQGQARQRRCRNYQTSYCSACVIGAPDSSAGGSCCKLGRVVFIESQSVRAIPEAAAKKEVSATGFDIAMICQLNKGLGRGTLTSRAAHIAKPGPRRRTFAYICGSITTKAGLSLRAALGSRSMTEQTDQQILSNGSAVG